MIYAALLAPSRGGQRHVVAVSQPEIQRRKEESKREAL